MRLQKFYVTEDKDESADTIPPTPLGNKPSFLLPLRKKGLFLPHPSDQTVPILAPTPQKQSIGEVWAEQHGLGGWNKFCAFRFQVQSNLDYPDLDYPDFSIIRTFSLVPFFS